MKYLLDTHTLLWLESAPDKLSERVRGLCLDQENVLLMSAASLWEIQIKLRSGKLTLLETLMSDLLNSETQRNYQWLPIQPAHISAYSFTPILHKDPFDLMLITQAIYERVPILSHDAQFTKYPVRVIW